MTGFISTLLQNLSALPANVARGLHPGAQAPGGQDVARMRRSFIFHIHPLTVRERTLDPLTTLGLGVATVTLFAILSVTGVLLMVYYVPTTRDAYASMQDIQWAIAFGPFVRALHRWAAHGMTLTVALHLARVAFTGAYRGRELNWLFGLGLLSLTVGLAFTGYLLPWDQRSFWATSVASAMLDNVPLLGPAFRGLLQGGAQVGQAALTRFYALHVAMLPGALFALGALHLWRVRKDGGLAVAAPEGGSPDRPAWPALVLREAVLVVLVVAAFSLVASFIDAPLGAPADYHRPSNPEKAPWYFLWIQEMVSYSASMGGFVVPALVLLGLLAWPFLEREDDFTGRWFGGPRSRRAAASALPAAVAAFVAFEFLYLPAQAAGRSPAPKLLLDLVNPAGGMLLLSMLAFAGAGFLTRSTRAAFTAAMVVMLVAAVGFTVVGLCRGPEWTFFWPWQEWPHEL